MSELTDRLVEAAAQAIQQRLDGDWTTDGRIAHPEWFGERAAGDALQAVLLLLADAVEAQQSSNEFRNVVIQRCAALIREAQP